MDFSCKFRFPYHFTHLVLIMSETLQRILANGSWLTSHFLHTWHLTNRVLNGLVN